MRCSLCSLTAIVLLFSITPISAQGTAQDLSKSSPVVSVGADAGYDSSSENGAVGSIFFALGLKSAYFDLGAKLSLQSNSKYAPAEANLPGKEFFGLYFLMEEGDLGFHAGPLALKAGRFAHYDVIDSPYSLFVNGMGQTALLANLRYEDDFFFYETRWVELNHRSAAVTAAWPQGYIDRGANIKTYGFKLNPSMRLGFQDSAVYTGRNFDYEYFLSPIPQYFLQYAKTNEGRPWTTGGNEGNMIGAFWDWERSDGISLNAQVLMDDFNIHFIAPDTPWQPWKLAWTFGGRARTSLGNFGFYHAGATKYTFEPISMKDPANWEGKAYGYTYYPDTRFNYDDAGADLREISIEDNALGYIYGENNIAFRGDWRNSLSGFDLMAALEFRLMGSNSPANPWQDSDYHPGDGSHLLDDAVLEKRFLASFDASRQFGNWRLGLMLKGGVAFDALELREPTEGGTSDGDKYIWLYAPKKGNTIPIFRLTIGGSYAWKMR